MAKPDSLLKKAFAPVEMPMKPLVIKPKMLPKTPKLLKVAKRFKQLAGK